MDDDEKRKQFASKVYVRQEGDRQVMGVSMTMPEREIARLRRCQNCQWFDTGEAFTSHYNFCISRDLAYLSSIGVSRDAANAQAARVHKIIFEHRGEVGYCTKRIARKDKQAADDFTAMGYLCDQWTGAFGMKFGPEHGPVDKLPDEILDDRGELKKDDSE